MSYQALLFCPDEKTARVVTQVLTELDFTVEPCHETFAAVKKLMAQHFDAIVVDCDNEQNATLLFKSARNSAPNQNSLSVAVVEGQAGVAKAFRIGANLVLTKPINVEQSKGTLRVARGLLRKADNAKPAGSSPAESQAHLPPVASLNTARTASAPLPEKSVTPFPAMSANPASGTSESAGSGFELEEEESPKPEPAEAALLESMPDPLAAKPATFNSKELPWKPVSMPTPSQASTGPEPGAKASSKSPAAEKAVLQPLGFGETKKTKDAPGLGSPITSAGSAAAPAPAKESPRTLVRPPEAKSAASMENSTEVLSHTIPTTAPSIEPPMFSALSVKDHETGEESGSKKPFVLVLVAVLLIAAGYVGWTRFHAPATQPVAPSAAASVPLPAPAPATAPAPVPELTTPAESPSTTASREAAQIIAPDTTRSAQSGTMIASSAKPTPVTKIAASEPTPSADTKPSATGSAAQPLVVKHDAGKQSSPKQTVAEVAQPAAPGLLGIGANSDEKAIAGIMSAAPTTVPKPTLQTLRISQGVSQGLLVKRVQPTYPPQAMQMRLQGSVLLDAQIGKDGSIVSVKRVSGDTVLARAATDAVKQWKYKPYYLNGEPVEIDTQITVNFKLP